MAIEGTSTVRRDRRASAAALALVLVVSLTAGCAGIPRYPRPDYTFGFFGEVPSDRDFWHDKVADWQVRQRTDLAAMAAEPAAYPSRRRSGLLSIKQAQWEQRERRELAKRIFLWTQEEARAHYRFDPITDVAGDPWPTSKNLFDTNGDDCDGLDLIAYELMRSFGFPADELYRAVIRRDRDGGNHMVTLWFEDPEDPWVMDATGAMSRRLRRFSEFLGWTPTKVFNEYAQFTPVKVPHGTESVARVRRGATATD